MTLEETYYEINKILYNNAEPLESVRLVEIYRRYWKPETVRVVLLAESHVFTSDEDRRIAIPPIDGLPEYPTQYARFVYCLGLGERDLTNDPHHPRRDGTPQFRKVLYACDNRIENLDSTGCLHGVAVSAVPVPTPTIYLPCDYDLLRPDETWHTVVIAVLVAHAHAVSLSNQRNKVFHIIDLHIVLLEPRGARHILAVVPFMRGKYHPLLPSPGHDIRQSIHCAPSASGARLSSVAVSPPAG